MSEQSPGNGHVPEGLCGTCHHPVADHYRNPSCRSCRCSRDPACTCGQLASKHDEQPIRPGKED